MNKHSLRVNTFPNSLAIHCQTISPGGHLTQQLSLTKKAVMKMSLCVFPRSLHSKVLDIFIPSTYSVLAQRSLQSNMFSILRYTFIILQLAFSIYFTFNAWVSWNTNPIVTSGRWRKNAIS